MPATDWPLETLFSLASAVVTLAWLALALTPPRATWAPRVWRITGSALPVTLALAYVALILRYWGPGGFGSLAEVQALFKVPGLLLAGWLHYLAFDLFVGTVIAQRAAAEALPRWALLPILALTFLFGPAGYLAYQAARVSLKLQRHSAVSR